MSLKLTLTQIFSECRSVKGITVWKKIFERTYGVKAESFKNHCAVYSL